MSNLNFNYVKVAYSCLIKNLITLSLIPFIGCIIMFQASNMKQEHIDQLWLQLQQNLFSLIICWATIVFGITTYIMRRPRQVYLVDFVCYKPQPHLKVPFSKFMIHSIITTYFNASSLDFQRKILERSGLGEALKTNITTLGPLVLPMREKLLFLCNLLSRKLLGSKMKSYVPNFKLAFNHFCIHAGSKAVIDEVKKSLQLQKSDIEASKMTLQRFGNTCSSSIWYELAYIEAKHKVKKKGNRVWQIAFRSLLKLCKKLL